MVKMTGRHSIRTSRDAGETRTEFRMPVGERHSGLCDICRPPPKKLPPPFREGSGPARPSTPAPALRELFAIIPGFPG